METLDLSRWQFGITTVYHFFFVPLTIGLAPIVALLQTLWVVKKDAVYLKLTKFFGKLFLINFALGIVTGIVQEFQFGMNWSEYARFVGDVFGAPLALEGLAAFFIESTFLGLWIFGWDRLSKRVHLTCIWLVAIGVNLSAYFIIAANSFMQHPVGAEFNAEKGRAELTSIWALLTNNTALAAFPHVITGAFLVAATFVSGIASWHMVRGIQRARALRTANALDAAPAQFTSATSDRNRVKDLVTFARVRGSKLTLDKHASSQLDPTARERLAEFHEKTARGGYRTAARLGLWLMVLSAAGLFITGDMQAKLMFEQQPMKMASAEALCESTASAEFSILAVGTIDMLNNDCSTVEHVANIPALTSFLATGDFNAELKGVNELQAEYTAKYGEGNYKPNLFTTYWSFRLMMGFAIGSGVLAGAVLWLTRKGRTPDQNWFAKLAIWLIPTPFLANSAGWIFTEIGRQPWVVAPNPTGDPAIAMKTAAGVSDHIPATVATSLIVFALVYGALALVWFNLMRRYAADGIGGHETAARGDDPLADAGSDGSDSSDSQSVTPLSVAY